MFSFFLFPVSIPPCLCYRFPPPLSHWALCDSIGAWTKLWSDQRYYIKCCCRAFCILSKWRGPWDNFVASNKHFSSAKTELWHINRRFISLAIAGKQHMNGLTHTPGDKVLHEKRKKGHTRADSRVFDQSPELVPHDPIFNLIFTHYNPVSCVPNLVFHFPF